MFSSFSTVSSVKPVTGSVAKVKKKQYLPPLPGLFSEPIQIHKIKKAPRLDDNKLKQSSLSTHLATHKTHSSASVKKNIFSDQTKICTSSDIVSTTNTPAKFDKGASLANASFKEKTKPPVSKEDKAKLSSKKVDHHHRKHDHFHKKKSDREFSHKRKSDFELLQKKKHHEQKLSNYMKESTVCSNDISLKSISECVETPKVQQTSNSSMPSSAAKSPVYIYSAKGESNSIKVVFDEDNSETNVSHNEKSVNNSSESFSCNMDNTSGIQTTNSKGDEAVDNVTVNCAATVASKEIPPYHTTDEIQPAEVHKATIAFTDEDVIVSDPTTVIHNNPHLDSSTPSPSENIVAATEESHQLSVKGFTKNLGQDDQETDQVLNNDRLEHNSLKRKLSDSSIVKHKHKKHKHDREHRHSLHKHKHKHKKHKREKQDYSEVVVERKFQLSPKVKLESDMPIVVKTEESDAPPVYIKKEALSTDYFLESPMEEKHKTIDDLRIPRRGVLEFSYGQALSSDVEIVNKYPFSYPEFRKFVHVETDPNGEASVLHAYQHEIAELSPLDQELFAKDFCSLCFQETSSHEADFVMGIVHGAASYMPDYLEYLSEEHPQLRVKTEVLGQRDILTMNVKEFRDQVCKTFSKESGMYR